MAISLVEISGRPAENVKKLENGSRQIIFKIPNRLNNEKESYYKVIVDEKVWNKCKISTSKMYNYYIIKGHINASVTSKAIPFITVNCEYINALNIEFDETGIYSLNDNMPAGTDELIFLKDIKVSDSLEEPRSAKEKALKHFLKYGNFNEPIRVNKDSLNLISGYKNYLIAKEFNVDKVPVSYLKPNLKLIEEDYKEIYKDWSTDEEVVQVNTKDIILTEEEHLNTVNMGFMIDLNKISKSRQITTPSAVRPIEDGKYSLLVGVSRYFAAKILDIDNIPVVIKNMSREEFIEGLKDKARTRKKEEKKEEKKENMQKKQSKKSCIEEIDINLITIPKSFEDTTPRAEKIKDTVEYYEIHGKFDKPIYVKGEDNILTDGYKRYVAAKKMGLKYVEVIHK